MDGTTAFGDEDADQLEQVVSSIGGRLELWWSALVDVEVSVHRRLEMVSRSKPAAAVGNAFLAVHVHVLIHFPQHDVGLWRGARGDAAHAVQGKADSRHDAQRKDSASIRALDMLLLGRELWLVRVHSAGGECGELH